MTYEKLFLVITIIISVICIIIYLKIKSKSFLFALIPAYFFTIRFLEKTLTTSTVILWIFWIISTLVLIFIELIDNQKINNSKMLYKI